MRFRRSPRGTRRLVATIGLACLVVTGVSVATPASAATANGSLLGVRSQRCVDVPGFTATNGTQVMLWDCVQGNDNQVWTYTTGKQLLVYAGKCLDALLPNNAPGTKVAIWDCNGQANQQWNINSNGTVTNVQSGLCLDPANNGTGNGTLIQLWTCTGQQNQQWTAPRGTPGPACRGTGRVTYTLKPGGNPTADQVRRITEAMNKAVAVYNCYSSLSKSITVEYNAGVPTADGNINGNIRFGKNAAYMVQATAMHETAHTIGVGTHGSLAYPLIDGSRWTGSNAVNELRAITGNSGAVLSVGGGHFWPYGLNHASEAKSPDDYVNHMRMVVAVARDLGVSPA